jgi:hypothetical protein
MRVLTEIPSVLANSDYAIDEYWSSVFPISADVLNYVGGRITGNNTVGLFSGSPKLRFDATYIEPFVFSTLPVTWHKNTIFADPKNKKLLNYTIKKLNPDTLLILNSNLFIRYRVWSDILQEIHDLKKLAARVVVTVPMLRFDFNRLKFTEQEITSKLGGILLDNTVIVCQ